MIVDPHSLEDVQRGENLNVNNPLSQDPDSVWGRYFRNAELERIIESDLTRLYPEHGSFFQSVVCQAMLRRILLVWSLIYPQYGYRQGMHEVLAPLVYVLHVDATHLSRVRQRYEDPFEDRFGIPTEEGFFFSKEGRQAASSSSARSNLRVSNESMLSVEDDWIDRVHPEDLALVEPDDFGFNLKTMVLGSDSYGAEGELGALLSRRFVEHDAYCMFDALMRGQGGAVVLADYFSAFNEGGTGLSPVLEASADMYHSLAAVDMPLYIHLVGLAVEPQFFALRWLRVLFGREFDLEKLLLLWDAVFSASNNCGESFQLGGVCKSSARGSFISNFAVSMILYLRSTLLAASNATACLQKLLNFPKHVDIRNLIEHAKTLHMHTEELLKRTPSPVSDYSWIFERSRGSKHKSVSSSSFVRAQMLSSRKGLQQWHSFSPEMSRPPLPESYWEEKWISSILPKEDPSSASAPLVDSESIDVARSISTPEEILVNSSSRECNAQASDTSTWDCAKKLTMRNLFIGALDRDISNEDTADVFRKEASFNDCIQSNGKNSGAAENGVLVSSEGSNGAGGKEVIKHVCIRALDLNGGTTMSEHLPKAAECLCSSCNNGSQEELEQSSRRRHSAGDLTATISEGRIDGVETIKNLESSCRSMEDSNNKHLRASLQALGQSMVESIQVLESALSIIGNEGGSSTAHRITAELAPTASNNSKGHMTALTALTDLRKISNILLQM